MVDFKKRLGSKSIQKKINPIEIYDDLDRRSETNEIRPMQREVLTDWYSNRKNERDLILKLHTGQGKTLTGLLILQSRLNESAEPCMYVCPNIYLMEQTCKEADKFGIGHVTIGSDKALPDQFLNAQKILITYVQKLFNGKSVFGIGTKSVNIDTIILDDSHACIEHINQSFKIKLKSDHKAYKSMLSLFGEDLREQGEGSFSEIENGYSTQLAVPYWSWQEKKSEVIKILLPHIEEKQVVFTWGLIKNSLEHCQCIFNGKELEIAPFTSPVQQFGTFSKAKHRVLMSATTQNDSFFIKGLSLSLESVKKPLISKNEKWSGEKMVLIPSLILDELEWGFIIHKIVPSNDKRRSGVVVITPSKNKASIYEKLGCKVTNTDTIFDAVSDLKKGQYADTVVVVNRYDGIDLPDDACRVLIIDSLPYAETLTEQYEEMCRSNSELANIKIAQKVEQGLGRSVRGEKDYSVIFIVGNDLIRFIKGSATKKFFSEQTKKQIDIGLEIAEIAKDDLKENQAPFSVLNKIVLQCVQRDDGWKEFYKEQMDLSSSKAVDADQSLKILEILELERKAEDFFFKGDTEDAITCIQTIIDKYCTDNQEEKGWYLQTLARYRYKISKVDSNKTQLSAFKNNLQLLKPKEGMSYKQVNYINESRIKRIINWLGSHGSYQDLMLILDEILENLTFGKPAEKFEAALKQLGDALGFVSQRPDKEFKKGADNLWCVATGEYFIFECKSEVEDSRAEIHKSETGGMNNHCGWFEQEYKTDKVKRILIIPTKNVAAQGNFTHKVEIMKKGKLKDLRDNVRSFFKEFKDYDLKSLSDSKIQEWLMAHKLDNKSLATAYTEEPYQRRQ